MSSFNCITTVLALRAAPLPITDAALSISPGLLRNAGLCPISSPFPFTFHLFSSFLINF